jgi:hypothetical protein
MVRRRRSVRFSWVRPAAMLAPAFRQPVSGLGGAVARSERTGPVYSWLSVRAVPAIVSSARPSAFQPLWRVSNTLIRSSPRLDDAVLRSELVHSAINPSRSSWSNAHFTLPYVGSLPRSSAAYRSAKSCVIWLALRGCRSIASKIASRSGSRTLARRCAPASEISGLRSKAVYGVPPGPGLSCGGFARRLYVLVVPSFSSNVTSAPRRSLSARTAKNTLSTIGIVVVAPEAR